MSSFLEHHVNQQIVVDIIFIRGPDFFKETMSLADLVHDRFGFWDHLQRIVVTDSNTLRAPFALTWINDDGKAPAFLAFLFWAVIVLTRARPLTLKEGAIIRVLDRGKLFFEIGFRQDFSQDGRVGTFRDTVHATRTLIMKELGYLGRDIAKIAQRCRASRNYTAGDGQVRGQRLLTRALFIAANDTLVEIIDVQNGQLDLQVRLIDQRPVTVIVMWISIVGFVHRRWFHRRH